MEKIDIKSLVKDNNVIFDRYFDGNFYMSIIDHSMIEPKLYEFPVPIEDTKGMTLQAIDKAIFYMRWIRLALETGTFREITKVGEYEKEEGSEALPEG